MSVASGLGNLTRMGPEALVEIAGHLHIEVKVRKCESENEKVKVGTGPEPLVEVAGHLHIEVAFHHQGNRPETHPGRLDKAGSRIGMQRLVKV